MVQENQREAFSLTWWPIDLAIAWVLTRDRVFVERQWKRQGDGLIGVEVAVAVDQSKGKTTRLAFPTMDAAWTELKGALEEGRIVVVGTPFVRGTLAGDTATETSEPQRTIPETEIGSLMLMTDDRELCLVPEDWRVAHGSNVNNLRGYRSVQVRVAGTLHFFPIEAAQRLPSEYLGPPRDPFKPGWMPVSEAAYWIASDGGHSPFDFRDESKWKAAFDRLLTLLSSGTIAASGRKHGRGIAATIDPVAFAGIAVDYPYSDAPLALLLGERPHLQTYGVSDPELWEKAFHDSLMGDDRRIPEYSHVQVRNDDLAREFPFSNRSNAKEPGLRQQIREVAKRLWPDGNMPMRVKERDRTIQAEFQTPPHERTIRRAFQESAD